MAETEHITDSEGNKIQFLHFEGHTFHVAFPKDVQERFERFKTFKCKKDDVIICSFPKTGAHWFNNIVGMLKTGNTNYKGSPMFIDYHDLDDVDARSEPRVYASHLLFDLLPPAIKNNEIKIINLLRNPKDTAISYHKFITNISQEDYKGNFNGFLHAFLGEKFWYDGWFNYVKHWDDATKSHPKHNILNITFEETKKDTMGVLRKLCKFLEIAEDETFLEQIVINTNFKKLKTEHHDEAQLAGGNMSEFMVDGVFPIFRKGDIGDWKNHLTVAQNNRFDEVYATRMKGYEHLPVVFK